MSMEWFDRVCSEMQDYLESICEQYDEIGHMNIDRAAKHPKMEFFFEYEDHEREVFCNVHFDPNNEEFYVEEYDLETDRISKVLLPDIEDIIDTVHELFHAVIEEEYDEVEEIEEDDVYDEYDEEDEFDDEEVEYRDEESGYDVVVDVEWTSPEVLAYSYLDEVEVTYKFGVVKETGDGILHRVNRIYTDDDQAIEDETNFIFSKEEAGAIIELIESNMNVMEGFDASREYS